VRKLHVSFGSAKSPRLWRDGAASDRGAGARIDRPFTFAERPGSPTSAWRSTVAESATRMRTTNVKGLSHPATGSQPITKDSDLRTLRISDKKAGAACDLRPNSGCGKARCRISVMATSDDRSPRQARNNSDPDLIEQQNAATADPQLSRKLPRG
jgi:hypothetical protein